MRGNDRARQTAVGYGLLPHNNFLRGLLLCSPGSVAFGRHGAPPGVASTGTMALLEGAEDLGDLLGPSAATAAAAAAIDGVSHAGYRCQALLARDVFRFFVHPPRFTQDGYLSMQYGHLYKALLRHPARTRSPREALCFFLGIDVGCELHWPHYGDMRDRNYILGDWKSCRETRVARLDAYLAGLETFVPGAAPHVVFDMFGWMQETPRRMATHPSVALAGPGFALTDYRAGVDVSFPLMPVVRLPVLDGQQKAWVANARDVDAGVADFDTACNASRWRYLMTFRGSDSSVVRRKLVELHDGEDNIILLKPHKEPVSTFNAGLKPALTSDYLRLMTETRFALAPRGDNPQSIRLFEIICAGAVPVILANDWVLPFSEDAGADYESFAVRVSEAKWKRLPQILRRYSDAQVCRMQLSARDACDRHFGSFKAHADTLLSILASQTGTCEASFRGASPTWIGGPGDALLRTVK